VRRVLGRRGGIEAEGHLPGPDLHVVARLGPRFDDAPRLEEPIGLEHGGEREAPLYRGFAERRNPSAFGKGSLEDPLLELVREALVQRGLILHDSSNHADLLPRLLEYIEGALELRARMRGHVARAEQGVALGHGRRDDGIRIHAVLVELLPESEALLVVVHDDGDDRRLRPPDIEAEIAVALHHEAGVFPETLDVLGLLLHDVEGSHRGHDEGSGERGGEDEGPGMVLDVVDHVLVADDEAAEGGEALREGAHGDIDLLHEVEVRRGTAALPQDADRVRVVDVEASAARLADLHELRQVDDIAAHGEYAVHHDEASLIGGNLLEDPVELIEVAVDEALDLAVAEPAGVHDARVVFLVGDHHVVLPYQRRDRAEIGLHAGAEDEGGLLAHEGGQAPFQLLVDGERAVDEAASRRARAEIVDCLLRRGLDLRVEGKAEVVVRSQHEHLAALHHDLGALGAFQRLEEGVDALFHRDLVPIELGTLLENVHSGLLFAQR
jgi:hypothetical protein